MADDKKNPWPMVIFFGMALGLLWLLMDTLKPPASVKTAPVAVDDGATAPAPQATSATADVSATAATSQP
jgi:hypothetical protein